MIARKFCKVTPIIIANWKMNFNLEEAFDYCRKISHSNYESKLVICPPAPYLAYLSNQFPELVFGAQNVSRYKDFGALTGEYSALQLESENIRYSIIGHSDRRGLFFETNEVVKQKAQNCAEAGITPIICVGECLEERRQERYLEFIKSQVKESVPTLKGSMIVAYEPVWAISSNSNLTASREQIKEVINLIYSVLSELELAKNVRLVYGGSVNISNIEAILSLDHVSGVLVGSASLNYNDIIQILGEKKNI